MRKTVLLIGDSIRMGYRSTVIEELVELAKIRTPEENCGPSSRIVANLDKWVGEERVDVAHVNCGLHDIKREPDADAEMQVPLADYEANLETIFTRLTAVAPVVIFALTTPVVEEKHNVRKPFVRLQADVDAVNAIARRVAEKHGVLINDLPSLLPDPAPLMTDDGVHFTARGYELLGQVVAAAICKHL